MNRVGLVGYGLAGSVFHEPLLRACDRFELAAVLTSREHRLRVRSYDELLECSNLVVVATPNDSHFPLTRTALEKGKHVVVDKPFTVTIEHADEVIAIASERERTLSVFHNRRWDSDYSTVRGLLPRLGAIELFEANWDRFRPEIKRGWREMPGPGTGLFNDLGPHLIDQALQLFGMPDAVDAKITTERANAVVDDSFEVTLHYREMRARLRASSLTSHPRPRFAVQGASGSFVKHGLDPQEAQLKSGMDPRDAGFGVDPNDGRLVHPDGRVETVPSLRGNYLAFYEGVADAILNGGPVPVAPEDARDGLLLINLARRASELGQRLPVPAASSPEA